MSIKANIDHIRQQIPKHVALVCVSKFQADELIMEAYQAGERIFGESKVQEMLAKHNRLPADIHWHFIGHLQTNKVKYVVGFVDLIHGVDTLKLLKEINKQGAKINRKVNCLLQIHIAAEETKFGFDEVEIRKLFDVNSISEFQNINFCGLMGMATYTDNQEQLRSEFQFLKAIFDNLKSGVFLNCADFKILSMGMSDDFPIAVESGSTMVRVGSRIFGNRNVCI